MFCILISKVISVLLVVFIKPLVVSDLFCLATVVFMPFKAFGSGLVWLISVRPLIGFEPCNNLYLVAFVSCRARLFVFVAR